MPESRIRRKAAFTPPPAKSSGPKPNPRWFVPLMLALMLVGLVWIVVFYVTETQYPVPHLGNWNLIAGFAFVLSGFVMTTRWR
ncbi:MAG TPA: cell division protein CrgA [Actinomycetales bacterium]|nr:cell division protein CrgA [Actinomycetales bacterium]